MKDCELTVTVDITKLPEEYRRGRPNPFYRVDETQLNQVADWIIGHIPTSADEVCVEIVGKMPGPVGLLIGGALRDCNCVKLTCVNPGNGMLNIWDYLGGE